MSIIEGALLAICLSALGYRSFVPRFYIVAVIALLLGLSAALMGLSDIPGSTVTFSGTGFTLLISGGFALLRYLRDNPLPDEAPHP